MNDLRTPLSRVRSLGSAREGTNRFIAQRLSAIALVPLILWFVVSIIFFINRADHAHLIAWLRLDWHTELFILLILFLFYHAHAGLQEVLEDYVHNEIVKAITMVSMKFVMLIITVASILAVLRMGLGG